MNLRQRLLKATDRLLAFLVVALLVGTTLAFGGAVWWARPIVAFLTFLFVLSTLAHILLEGSFGILKSPLTLLGVLALGLAIAQLAPLPSAVAGRLSPRSREVYAFGLLPTQARAIDPSLVLSEPANVRSPMTIDRSATLRWLAGATVCLALFWGVSRFADRLRHLYIIWGSLIGAFLLNTAIAIVQVTTGANGLYGFIEPGNGPRWAPSVNDLIAAPNATVLRPLAEPLPGHPAWLTVVPDRPFAIGTMLGGQSAYLALGSIGLPLALALALQLMAPRGSREGLRARIGESGQGGLIVLLLGLVVISAVLVGLLAGPILCVPFAVALLVVGLPSAWPTGLRWTAVGLTALSLLALGGGALIGDVWAKVPGARPPTSPEGIANATRVWADAWRITGDFPIFGSGLGSFGSIYPYYKTQDQSQTTALSSLIQWWVESGAMGMGLLVIGVLWCLIRMPGAVRRVGSADRSLVFGLIGAAVGFTLYSALHWTVELAAVALAASALGGIGNRWLAGGTDLFVERG